MNIPNGDFSGMQLSYKQLIAYLTPHDIYAVLKSPMASKNPAIFLGKSGIGC
jgi:hypothetical protein